MIVTVSILGASVGYLTATLAWILGAPVASALIFGLLAGMVAALLLAVAAVLRRRPPRAPLDTRHAPRPETRVAAQAEDTTDRHVPADPARS